MASSQPESELLVPANIPSTSDVSSLRPIMSNCSLTEVFAEKPVVPVLPHPLLLGFVDQCSTSLSFSDPREAPRSTNGGVVAQNAASSTTGSVDIVGNVDPAVIKEEPFLWKREGLVAIENLKVKLLSLMQIHSLFNATPRVSTSTSNASTSSSSSTATEELWNGRPKLIIELLEDLTIRLRRFNVDVHLTGRRKNVYMGWQTGFGNAISKFIVLVNGSPEFDGKGLCGFIQVVVDEWSKTGQIIDYNDVVSASCNAAINVLNQLLDLSKLLSQRELDIRAGEVVGWIPYKAVPTGKTAKPKKPKPAKPYTKPAENKEKTAANAKEKTKAKEKEKPKTPKANEKQKDKAETQAQKGKGKEKETNPVEGAGGVKEKQTGTTNNPSGSSAPSTIPSMDPVQRRREALDRLRPPMPAPAPAAPPTASSTAPALPTVKATKPSTSSPSKPFERYRVRKTTINPNHSEQVNHSTSAPSRVPSAANIIARGTSTTTAGDSRGAAATTADKDHTTGTAYSASGPWKKGTSSLLFTMPSRSTSILPQLADISS